MTLPIVNDAPNERKGAAEEKTAMTVNYDEVPHVAGECVSCMNETPCEIPGGCLAPARAEHYATCDGFEVYRLGETLPTDRPFCSCDVKDEKHARETRHEQLAAARAQHH